MCGGRFDQRIIHLLALAGRVGVPLTLDRFDEIARRVPLIANVQPAGEHLTGRLMAAGGVPALLKRLRRFCTWMRERLTGAGSARSSRPPR